MATNDDDKSPIELWAFTCGWFNAPLSFFVGGDDVSLLRAPIPAYLIRHATKGLAVFDTGLGQRFVKPADSPVAGDQPGLDFTEHDAFAAQLKLAGVDPAEVRWIVNSHFHSDHSGGNSAFPNATIVVQVPEIEYARRMEDGQLYSAEDFDHGHEVLAISGEHDLFGDGSVMLFPTYGHTAGHQSARLQLASGETVLTADCCYLGRQLDELSLGALQDDREAAVEVLKRLRRMRDRGVRIVHGHDANDLRGQSGIRRYR